jgi:hypothetical protein
MSYDRQWLEETGSEDAHGRVIWALGVAINTNLEQPVCDMLYDLFMKSLQSAESFEHPRPQAFTLIGIDYYLRVYSEDTTAKKIRAILAKRLYHCFQEHVSEDWPWFGDMLTYANAQLPHALLLTGQALSNKSMLRIGLESLTWLLHQQTNEAGYLSIIGSDGWMQRNGKRAQFAQQPIEVMGLIRACTAAFHITKDTTWLNEVRRCFDWFLGKNDLNTSVYDVNTGGGHDGLECYGISKNMGAESTLSWLISLLTMYELSEYMVKC